MTFEGASCVDVCAEGNEAFYSSVFAFNGDLTETNNTAGSSLAVDLSFQILGSPCTASQELDQGTVTLNLFGKSGTARTIVRDGSDLALADKSAEDCDTNNYNALGDGEVAVGDSLCASISTQDFGSSSLLVWARLCHASPRVRSLRSLLTTVCSQPGTSLLARRTRRSSALALAWVTSLGSRTRSLSTHL